MFFRAKSGESVALFPPDSVPAPGITPIARLASETLLVADADQDPDRQWFKVTARLPGDDILGWVRASQVEPAEPPEPEPLDPWAFIKNCTLAARVINARQQESGLGINRDFLIAYALLHTGTRTDSVPQNIETGEGDGKRSGPFALSPDDWKRFVDSEMNEAGFTESGIRNPVFQCYGFGYLVFDATRALSQKYSDNDPTKSSGPWVPSSIDLFLYLACGEAAACALIEETRAGGTAKAVPLVNSKAGDKAASILQRYQRFFGTEADGLTVADVDQKVADALDAVLKRSFTLVREYTPEDVIYFVSGKLPWLVKAEEELKKGVAETGTPPNPEVVKYFGATGYDTSKEDPWCGAFVAWCLANCGDERAAKSVNRATAATAANWKAWGDVPVSVGTHEGDAVPPGAVVVLKPRSKTSDTTGHVGFFVSQDARTVSLLGGNQSDSVKISTYPRSQVVAIRMLKGFDSAVALGSGPGTPDPNFDEGTLGPFTKEDWTLYIRTLGKRESNNNYSAVNRFGYCGRWQFGALALTDGGYVRPGATDSRLAEERWWTGKDGVHSRADWLANKNGCQDTEMIEYTRRNYRSLLNVTVSKVFLERTGKPELAGILATSHLLGPGGARKILRGESRADANGTTGLDYYLMMVRQFGGNAVPPA